MSHSGSTLAVRLRLLDEAQFGTVDLARSKKKTRSHRTRHRFADNLTSFIFLINPPREKKTGLVDQAGSMIIPDTYHAGDSHAYMDTLFNHPNV